VGCGYVATLAVRRGVPVRRFRAVTHQTQVSAGYGRVSTARVITARVAPAIAAPATAADSDGPALKDRAGP
jgi:hypothetical protein